MTKAMRYGKRLRRRSGGHSSGPECRGFAEVDTAGEFDW